MMFPPKSPTFSYMVLDVFKIIIGYLLIAEQRKIVKFIELKQRRNHQPLEL